MTDESLIEAVARIIDPAAFGSGDDNPTFRHEQARLKAYARGKAKAAIKAHTEWLESKGLVVVRGVEFFRHGNQVTETSERMKIAAAQQEDQAE